MELLYKRSWEDDDSVAVKCKVLAVSENQTDGSLLFKCKIGNLDDTFEFPEAMFKDRVKSRDQVAKDYKPVEDALTAINKVLGIEATKKKEVVEAE